MSGETVTIWATDNYGEGRWDYDFALDAHEAPFGQPYEVPLAVWEAFQAAEAAYDPALEALLKAIGVDID